MKLNYTKILNWVLVHEGGYSNHPEDNGGETNQGITHRVYASWLKRQGQAPRSVKEITTAEVHAIYRYQYWDVVRGDSLPSGLDYAVFDFAVNSGPSRAAKFLQQVLGVEEDGVIGAVTLTAIYDHPELKEVIKALCDNRLAWLKRLSDWKHFGRGWGSRVSQVRYRSLELSNGNVTPAEFPVFEAPHTKPPATNSTLKPTEQVKDNAGNLTAGGVLTGLFGAVQVTKGNTQLLLVGGALLVVGFILWNNWKSKDRE